MASTLIALTQTEDRPNLKDKLSKPVAKRPPQVQYHLSSFIAIMCFIAGLTLVALNADVAWLDDPSSGTRRIEHIEHYALGKVEQSPKIVILGSSRPAFGIMGKRLAQKLGYSRSEGMNLAFPALYSHLLVKMVTRNVPTLTQAKVWVLGIDDYFLLSSIPKVKISMSPSEELETTVHNRLQPLVWFNERGKWLFKHLHAAAGLSTLPSLPWQLSTEGNWEDPVERFKIADPVQHDEIFKSIAKSYLADKYLNRELLEPYESLLQIAKKHNIQVVLVSLPYHPHYNHLVNQYYLKITQENRQAFKALATQYNAPLIECDIPETCGVTPKDFLDAVHLNHNGAIHFTAFLSEKLQTLHNSNKL